MTDIITPGRLQTAVGMHLHISNANPRCRQFSPLSCRGLPFVNRPGGHLCGTHPTDAAAKITGRFTNYNIRKYANAELYTSSVSQYTITGKFSSIYVIVSPRRRTVSQKTRTTRGISFEDPLRTKRPGPTVLPSIHRYGPAAGGRGVLSLIGVSRSGNSRRATAAREHETGLAEPRPIASGGAVSGLGCGAPPGRPSCHCQPAPNRRPAGRAATAGQRRTAARRLLPAACVSGATQLPTPLPSCRHPAADATQLPPPSCRRYPAAATQLPTLPSCRRRYPAADAATQLPTPRAATTRWNYENRT